MTTILGIISKPGLYAWQAKMGSLKANNVMERVRLMSPLIYDTIRAELGEEFFKDGYALSARAADYGTQAHGWIENILKGECTAAEAIQQATSDEVRLALQSFMGWWDSNDFELVKAESVVHSQRWGYAGTCDAILRNKDGIILADWKTSKRIYPEHKLQTVAYKCAIEEMSGEKVNQVWIYRFGKDGSFEDYQVPEAEHRKLMQKFLEAKSLWEWQREEESTWTTNYSAPVVATASGATPTNGPM